MIRTASHPLFFIPVLIILFTMSLAMFTGHGVTEYHSKIILTLSDKIPKVQDELENSLLDTRESLERYALHNRTPENLEQLKKNFEISRERLSALEKLFIENNKDLKTPDAAPVLSATHLVTATEEAASAINEISQNEEQKISNAREKLANLADKVQDFEVETSRTHSREVQELMDLLEKRDFQRNSFIALSWVACSILILFLFHNTTVFRRKSEAAYKAEQDNALFAAALQSTQAGVMIRDLQKENTPIVFSNKAFTSITGYDFGDIIDKPLSFLFGQHTSQEKAMAMRQAFFERRPFVADMLVYRKDGSPLWSEFSMSPVINKEGQISHIVAMIVDISSLRETQEALLKAKEEAEKAVSVKGHFLAAMSHELRTPINGILGVLELLSDITLEDEQVKLVEIAKTSAKRLLEIVNDILDYSKIEAGKFEVEIAPFSLRQMVKEAIDLVKPLADAKKLPLVSSIADNTPDFLESDGGRIRQVLLNLISNAIKFTETGSIELKIFCLLEGLTAGQSALIRFEVIDTGLGIGVADQEKLFNEFMQVERSFTRRFEGTGLGLAISKQLIKLLGGEIGVESRIGQGSKFWFMLPLKAVKSLTVKKAEASSPPIVSAEGLKFSARILLAEDNPVNQLVANRYLQKAGCIVDVANNGFEAVEKFKTTEYDMVLMDVSMPEMDGLEATRMIRSIEGNIPKVPIVALTAHAMRGDREQCIAAGMNDYLSKPLSYETMVKALERWLPTPIPEPEDPKKPALTQTQPEKQSPPQEIPVDAPKPPIAPPPVEQKQPQAPPPYATMAIDDGHPAIFDPTAIDNLVNDLDIETMLRIATVFLEDMAKRYVVLKEKLSGEAGMEISDAAHALKSSSANCGLMRFSDLMKRIEMAGKANNIALARKLAEESLDSCYHASREALSAGLEKYK